MADYSRFIDGSTDITQLLSALRDQEDLYYRLTGFAIDAASKATRFDFDSHFDLDPPGPTDYLGVEVFAAAQDDTGRAVVRKNFVDFGGNIAADGPVNIAGQSIYAIVYRGAAPEYPAPHSPPSDLPPPSLPDHVRAIFDLGGKLAGIPWNSAQTIPMPLQGMKNNSIMVFRNKQTMAVEAFVMMTDADIDTDGPNGSKAIDPYWGPNTSLRYTNGASCDSRAFPGVVRSSRLFRKPLGLNIGDFAYICYKGRVVACQIYDQGPDYKIGEISLFAGRQVGGVPVNESEHDAALRGNFADTDQDLVTICFPSADGPRHALAIEDINSGTNAAFQSFIGNSAQFAVQVVPVVVQPAGSFNIYSRATWGALHPKVDSFAPGAAQGIVIHNTEGGNRTPALTPDAELAAAFGVSRGIQRDHMFNRGWSDVGQHFTVSRGGVIMEGRAGTLAAAPQHQVVQGAHAGVATYNQHWWGIELEGDYTIAGADPTPAQRAAVFTLCQWLSGLIPSFQSSANLKGHREVKIGGTDCPGHLVDGAHLPDFMQDIRDYLAANPGAVAPVIQ